MAIETIVRGMTLFVRDFPEDVWRRLKAVCALEGKSTREKLVELILDATKHLPGPEPLDKERK